MPIIIIIILIILFFPVAVLIAAGLILIMSIILAIGLLVWSLYRCYRKKEGKPKKRKIALCVAVVIEFILLIVGPENIIPTTIQYTISKNSWTGIIAFLLIAPFLIAMLVDTFVLTPKLKPVHKKVL